MNTKLCAHCGKVRSLLQFTINRQGKNGPIYNPNCKDCQEEFRELRKQVAREQEIQAQLAILY